MFALAAFFSCLVFPSNIYLGLLFFLFSLLLFYRLLCVRAKALLIRNFQIFFFSIVYFSYSVTALLLRAILSPRILQSPFFYESLLSPLFFLFPLAIAFLTPPKSSLLTARVLLVFMSFYSLLCIINNYLRFLPVYQGGILSLVGITFSRVSFLSGSDPSVACFIFSIFTLLILRSQSFSPAHSLLLSLPLIMASVLTFSKSCLVLVIFSLLVWISILISLFIYYFDVRKRNLQRPILAVLVGISLFLASIYFWPSIATISTDLGGFTSAEGRFDGWLKLLNYMGNLSFTFFTGLGNGAFRLDGGTDAHSLYITVFTDAGLVGIVFLVFLSIVNIRLLSALFCGEFLSIYVTVFTFFLASAFTELPLSRFYVHLYYLVPIFIKHLNPSLRKHY